MKAMTLSRVAIGVSLLAAAPTAARADVVTFTFESLAVQSGLTTLTLSGGGLTATLTRPGSVFAISDLSGAPAFLDFPVSWGARTLSPFSADGTATDQSNTPFILNFSEGITGISISMGDFGGDVDLLSLQLYSGLNGTGTLLGTSLLTLAVPTENVFTFLTPSLSSTAALSAVFIGGSTTPDLVNDAPNGHPNSVYYDNIAVTFTPTTTTTPEPASLALVASGFVGVGLIRRKKRA